MIPTISKSIQITSIQQESYRKQIPNNLRLNSLFISTNVLRTVQLKYVKQTCIVKYKHLTQVWNFQRDRDRIAERILVQVSVSCQAATSSQQVYVYVYIIYVRICQSSRSEDVSLSPLPGCQRYTTLASPRAPRDHSTLHYIHYQHKHTLFTTFYQPDSIVIICYISGS